MNSSDVCDGANGCSYGGFSCGYWVVVEGCDKYHPETHIVRDDHCPCGIEFPGAGTCKVVADHLGRPLPPGLRAGIGTPIMDAAVWWS